VCTRVGTGVGIRVDDGSGAVLAGVQAVGLLEPNHHLTVGLPVLLADVSGQVFGEGLGGEIPVGTDFPEVGLTKGDDVLIGSE
jgi:hypothetical protein